MRKINVELNQKSIQNAIKELTQIKNLFTKSTIVQEFLEEICEWIIKRANKYIDNSQLGELVKLKLRNSWTYQVTKNSAKIINNAHKIQKHQTKEGIVTEEVPLAVLVEFGVGVVGQNNPHPNADDEGYQYNVPRTVYGKSTKDQNGMWYFWTNSQDLDIPLNSIVDIRGYDDFRGIEGEQGKRIIVGTMGTQGLMYAYNAMVDAKMELQNPNSELSQKWNKLIKRYIG
jgi:hypothetical protein